MDAYGLLRRTRRSGIPFFLKWVHLADAKEEAAKRRKRKMSGLVGTSCSTFLEDTFPMREAPNKQQEAERRVDGKEGRKEEENGLQKEEKGERTKSQKEDRETERSHG